MRFVNRRRREGRRLTVRRVRSRDGYRVVVAYPGGLERLHTFRDEAALIAGTAALQANLAADGWEPLGPRMPRPRPAVPQQERRAADRGSSGPARAGRRAPGGCRLSSGCPARSSP